MVKLSKKLTREQQKDSNIYIFFCPSTQDSLKAFLPLSGKYGYILFDSSKVGVVELERLQLRLSTWKCQWDLIHDPENMLFAFMQDESEGAMEVELIDDYSNYNYSGHEQILEYLLDQGRNNLISELTIYPYFDKGMQNAQAAVDIISGVLGNVKIGDAEEAKPHSRAFAKRAICVPAMD